MKIIKSESFMHQLKNIIQEKKKKNEEEVEKKLKNRTKLINDSVKMEWSIVL